ncbi:hypothetical protein GH714_040556 [Hevea brasiliensis]|uniref:Uncharacterized protein n=1 Tax=Hevea brasiliensis TaxID=3981 RepID=A0A6A6MPS8_HEVBR|nr:hypothetical protein GH714_040556 [Hevea brasiliensis]
MARVKQVAAKPRKFMGDAMKAAGSSEKEREEGTKLRTVMKKQRQWQNSKKKKGKGLDGIFELNEYYYPYLIQEFDGSMKEVVKGESFSVRVKKKSQIVNVDFLASVLNLLNDGNRIGTFKDSRKLEGYDEKAFQLSIFSEGNQRKSGLTLSILEKSHELQKGIMAKQNAKMDMLINRLDRQEWFMKKMAQMLFGESFGKFGDFGSYPQGTAGPSNAKAAGPSGVKISEMEEEEEEHVEAAEKV